MDTFWQAVSDHDWAQPEIAREFRVYHDAEGRVLSYSMEDLPGDYIVVDRHTFEQFRFDVRIRDGKIVKINQDASWRLAPSDSGYACHPGDVSVIVDDTADQKKYWKVITTHEAN